MAGCERTDLFTPEAIQQIAIYSEGIPRLINTICDNALSIAYSTSQPAVSEEIVGKVVQNLRLQKISPPEQASKKKGLWFTREKPSSVSLPVDVQEPRRRIFSRGLKPKKSSKSNPEKDEGFALGHYPYD